MGKASKIWLLIAAFLVIIGCVIFGSVMAMKNWDFKKLSTDNYETDSYDITEEFENINIKSDTADIVFTLSENGSTRVVCYEEKNEKHLVSVNDNELLIQVDNTRKWYEHIGINFSTPKITISLPEAAYNSLVIKESTGDIQIHENFRFENIDILTSTGDVANSAYVKETAKIKTDTGDIRVEKAAARYLELSASTGDIKVNETIVENDIIINVSTGKANLSGVQCVNLISSGDTGDINLKDVFAVENFSINRSTGDVKFDGADAAEIFIETDTGDVSGRLLSDKIFIVKTDTGYIDVPKTMSGGKCEITTDTGDIKIDVKDN